MVELPSLGKRMVRHKAAVECPARRLAEYGPGKVGLPQRQLAKLVAPRLEDAPRARIGECRKREGAELFLNPGNVPSVVIARALPQASEVARPLVCGQHR